MKLVFIFFLTLSMTDILAQADEVAPCGTQMGISEWLADYQAGEISKRGNDDWLVVPMQVHITGEDGGSGYTSSLLIGQTINKLNQDFEQAKIQFFLAGEYNYIDNSTWHHHEDYFEGRQMMEEHNVANAVNAYICASAAGNCGYYTGGQDALVVADFCLGENSTTFSHEMGHLLSLPHTFLGWEGIDYDDSSPTPLTVNGREVEAMDTSINNCAVAADGFCDTPPDYLSYRWPCNSDGESNLVQYDPEEVPFRSQGRYIMSYSYDECQYAFSEEQIGAMRANIMDRRSHLLEHDRNYKPLPQCGSLRYTYPEYRDSVQFDDAILTWDSIRYIDHYRLTVSKIFNLSNPFIDTIVTDTFIQLDDLDPGINYYWQTEVQALHSPCFISNDRGWFFAHDFTATATRDDSKAIKAWLSDGILNISTDNPYLRNAKISIIDLTGRTIFQSTMPGVSSSIQLNTPITQHGVYLLQLESDDFHYRSKLMY